MKLSLFNKIEFVCGAEVLRLRTRQGGNRNRRSLRSSPLTPSQRTPMLQVYCVGWENDRETKATLHNSAACLAMSFPPSAACKFLDLLPVNLRNLHLHLTKNPFVSQPPHLCGVTLSESDVRWNDCRSGVQQKVPARRQSVRLTCLQALF